MSNRIALQERIRVESGAIFAICEENKSPIGRNDFSRLKGVAFKLLEKPL